MKSSDAVRLRDLLRYLIDAVWEAGRRPTRTRLMKLVYLVDVGHAQTHSGRTWSGLEWRFHHFGPYAAGLQQTLNQMDGVDADDYEHQGRAGRYHVYSGAHGAIDEGAIERLLDPPGRTTVRAVVQKWAGAGLNELLDFVYFETSPMKTARRGDALDFSPTQADLFRKTAVHNPRIPVGQLDLLRQRWKSRSSEVSERSGVSLSLITKPLGPREHRLLARAEGIPYPTPQGVVEIPVNRKN